MFGFLKKNVTSEYSPKSTQDAWDNHFAAFGAQDLDRIMLDYTEASELRAFCHTTGEQVNIKGLAAIRDFFAGLFKLLSDLSDLDAPMIDVTTNMVYLAWKCPASTIASAHDTFVFTKDHKVQWQNIAYSTTAGASTAATTGADEMVPYSSVCSINPSFTVQDWTKAEAIMQDFVEKTKTESGCVYYGWCRTGDKLKCREAYVDGAAINVHLENVGPCIQALLADGIATLDSIDIQCPSDQVGVVKPGTEALGTTYFEVHSGFTNMTSAAGGGDSSYTLCTIHPTFTVQDWAKAEAIMQDFVEKTKIETGCVYYGWCRTGDKLKCREAYVDGAAINTHLENVGPCIQALLGEGIATLDDIFIQCPSDQVGVVKPGTEALGTAYFEVHSGFSKYSMPKSM
jgi:quinol monooxygenase YgiN